MENQTQKFNILCVTMRHKVKCLDPRRPILWHVPITGVAEVSTTFKEELGVKITKTVVQFQGSNLPIAYVRAGLCGTAVTIAIERHDHPYNIWELYTDTPACPGVNAEQIREIAQRETASSSSK